jgi:hypothetical protein
MVPKLYCSKRRIYDEEGETDGHGCCRRFCPCCTCCYSFDYGNEEEKLKQPVKKPSKKKALSKKPTKASVKAAKSTRKKVVSKKGKVTRSRKGGKTLKKEEETETENGRTSTSREAKTVTAWKPFANPVRNINTSTK